MIDTTYYYKVSNECDTITDDEFFVLMVVCYVRTKLELVRAISGHKLCKCRKCQIINAMVGIHNDNWKQCT